MSTTDNLLLHAFVPQPSDPTLCGAVDDWGRDTDEDPRCGWETSDHADREV
ncbi:MAG: hypothetical protein M3Q39_15915 [Actinomycetota bacterium]|nr:hypothetical protein [Actinomycetota bacterium]